MLQTSSKFAFFFLALAVLLPLSTMAQGMPILLSPGKTVKTTIHTQRGEDSRRYQINVPNESWAIKIQLDASDPNLDLHLLNTRNEVLASAASPARHETLLIHRLSTPFALVPGTYFIEVSYSTGLPGNSVSKGAFGLSYDLVGTGTPQLIVPGVPYRGNLEPGKAMFQMFEVALPGTDRPLRVDLYGSEANTDLYLSFQPLPNPRDADYRSENLHGKETIIIEPRDLQKALLVQKIPRLFAIVAAPFDTTRQTYAIVVSVGRDAPAELRKIPAFPAPSGLLGKATQCTVELVTAFGTGSGCLVAPGGVILTNHHVIADDDNNPVGEVHVGVTLDATHPSDILFKGKVVEDDPDRDLAIVKIDRGFYDELPAGYRFPWLELGRPSHLVLGEDLHVLGYPGIGGLGSRASISYSKGVVSGFQQNTYGLVIKTDAIINTGSSGGSALDHLYRLVGLPTVAYGDGGSQFAFLYSIETIPTAWDRWFPVKPVHGE